MGQTEEAIKILSAAIDDAPSDERLNLERGKLYHQRGDFDKALNDFTRVVEANPLNDEAAAYIEMIREILNYRYKDIYNP